MGLTFFTRDGIGGTIASTHIAALTHIDTGIRIDGVDIELSTDMGRTFFVLDVSFVFVPEIPQCGQDRIGGGIAQAAQG